MDNFIGLPLPTYVLLLSFSNSKRGFCQKNNQIVTNIRGTTNQMNKSHNIRDISFIYWLISKKKYLAMNNHIIHLCYKRANKSTPRSKSRRTAMI